MGRVAGEAKMGIVDGLRRSASGSLTSVERMSDEDPEAEEKQGHEMSFKRLFFIHNVPISFPWG